MRCADVHEKLSLFSNKNVHDLKTSIYSENCIYILIQIFKKNIQLFSIKTFNILNVHLTPMTILNNKSQSRVQQIHPSFNLAQYFLRIL